MKRTIIAILILVALASGAVAQGLSAGDILALIDRNEAFASIEYTARIEIRVGGELRVKTMRAWAQGGDKAFVEYTNPEDKGTRMLKLGKDLWMYFPKEADTVRISGHLLKEGMMGSDVSYEDALESDSLAARYEATITGEETLGERRVYVLELSALTPAAPYARRVLRVDAERFVVLAEEMYAKSGKLLKTMRAVKVERIGAASGGRYYATTAIIEDKLRKGSSTTFIMESVSFDVALDPALFTRAALER